MKKLSFFTIILNLVVQLAWAGDGSSGNPFTVAEARALAKSSTMYYVQGYIVGGRYDDFDSPWSNDYAVSIADDASETDFNNCIQIKLEYSTGHRDIWGLNSNPGKVGTQIKAHGHRDDYGGSSNPSFEGVDDIVEVTGGGSTTTVAFSSASGTASEGDGTYTLTISIANEDGSNVTQCDIALTSGTASDLDSYTTQSVTFPAGSNTDQTVTVNITDDATFEGNESFTFTIQNVTGGNSAAAGSSSTFDLTLEDNDFATATIPYSEDFSDCGSVLWQPVSVASNHDWQCGSGYMEINGYGADVASDDYLISPAFNLDNYEDEIFTFESYTQYDDASYPPIELLYSTNFSGDVGASTWHPLTATWSPENSTTITASGNVDLSGISGTSVYLAFHYTSSGTGSGTSAIWRVSTFSLTEGGAPPPPPEPTLPNAWINEIHYDNGGPTDLDEMVEVVVERADTLNLADLAVCLYNGNNGTIYNTKTLDVFTVGDVIGDYHYFYYIYPTNGIQNGSPDGLSLEYNAKLIQFLSYEGTFEGVEGPADGITSTDIGVSENSSKPAGQSLQLTGIGLKYSHFSWVDPVATPGTLNSGQILAPPPPPVPIDWRYILLTFTLISGLIIYRKLR